MDWFLCSQSKKSSAPFTLILILLCCCSSPSLVFTFANASSSPAFNLTTISFDEGYSHLFGDGNLIRSPDGKNVRLLLNRFSGTWNISIILWSREDVRPPVVKKKNSIRLRGLIEIYPASKNIYSWPPIVFFISNIMSLNLSHFRFWTRYSCWYYNFLIRVRFCFVKIVQSRVL